MARRRHSRTLETAAYDQACRRWNGKPYYSLDCYLKQQFGEKLYKIAIDGGDLSQPGRHERKARMQLLQ